MSGGSHNYAYLDVESMAGNLRGSNDPLRRAFAKHLAKVAKAMHDVEWVDSRDLCDGDDREAMEAVLAEGAELSEAAVMAREAGKVLTEALGRAEARQKDAGEE